MSFIINLLLFIVILGVIVFVHEFGHFIFAKIAGVYVFEFAIGGGFCSMAGEDFDDEELKKVPKKRRLQAKTAWQRFLIMVFGPMNNFILAVILLFFIALVWGGSTMDPIITSVEAGSSAEEVGISSGDRILKINNHKISTSDDMSLYLAISDPKKYTTMKVEKENDEVVTYKIKPRKIKENGEEVYRYGIGIEQKKTKGFGEALVYTFKKTCSIFKQMYITLAYLFTGGIKLNQLAGPVGIYSIVGEQSKAGIANLLYLMAFLSINVGVINLLPIPAFDGGHILFIVIEKIKGSPVDPELENKIHAVFLVLLMLLMLVITFNDILRLFG